MKITVNKVAVGHHHNGFGTSTRYVAASVNFPEHGVSMGLSHRDDDPEGMWLADWRIESDGAVMFSHGEGDRTCLKQIAGPELTEAIEKAVTAANITV